MKISPHTNLPANGTGILSLEVCIVGGGPAGLIAAICCHRLGKKYVLVAEKEDNGSGMGFLMHENGLEVLRRMDIDLQLEKAGLFLAHAVFCMDDGSQHVMKMGENDLIALGRPEFMTVLFSEIPPSTVRRAKCLGVDKDTGLVRLDDGTSVRARLLIGADGVSSIIRQVYCKPPKAVCQAKVHELVTRIQNVPKDLMHLLAFQQGEPAFVKYYTHTRALGRIGCGFVPVTKDSLVWYMQFAATSENESLSDVSLQHAKAKEILHALPPKLRVLSELIPTLSFHWWRPRFFGEPVFDSNKKATHHPAVALVGDSRGSLSPFTSQGTASAMEDAECLVFMLGKYKLLQDCIEEYTKRRRPIWHKLFDDGSVLEKEHLYYDLSQQAGAVTVPWTSAAIVSDSESTTSEEGKKASAWTSTSPFKHSSSIKWSVERKKVKHHDASFVVNHRVLSERAYNFRWAECENDVIPLTAADLDFPAPACVGKAMTDYIQGGYFCYGPSRGLPGFRQAAAKVLTERKHMPGITAENVLPVDSAAAAIFHAVKAAVEAKKGSEGMTGPPEVIIPDPVDFLLIKSITAAGGVTRRWSISRDKPLNFEALEALFNENTALFSFCNPHNPLGYLWSPEELCRIGSIAEKKGALILSDDIWSDVVFWDSPHGYTSITSLENGRFSHNTISIFGFSKTFGIAGLRIGFIAAQNLQLLEAVAEVSAVDLTVEGVSTLSQVAGQAAYESGWNWFDNTFLDHLHTVRDFMVWKCQNTPGLCGTEDSPVTFYPPMATFVWLLDIRHTVDDSKLDEFVQFALEKHRVRVVPGNERFFGPGAQGHVRISFATSMQILGTGLDRLGAALVAWKSQQLI